MLQYTLALLKGNRVEFMGLFLTWFLNRVSLSKNHHGYINILIKTPTVVIRKILCLKSDRFCGSFKLQITKKLTDFRNVDERQMTQRRRPRVSILLLVLVHSFRRRSQKTIQIERYTKKQQLDPEESVEGNESSTPHWRK